MFEVQVRLSPKARQERVRRMIQVAGRTSDMSEGDHQYVFYGWHEVSFDDAVCMRRKLSNAGYLATAREV